MVDFQAFGRSVRAAMTKPVFEEDISGSSVKWHSVMTLVRLAMN